MGGVALMKYYKNTNGEVWAFEADGSQDDLITDEFVAMTADEIDRHVNPLNYLSDEEKEQLRLAQFTPLTRYQFFRALLESGYKSADIEAQIQTIEDDYQRELVLLGWQSATNFVRTDESVLLMQNMLDWTDEQVEQMWTYAMTL